MNYFTKLKWNLPWLVRYPLVRGKAFFERMAFEKKHIIFTIANHFEPSWNGDDQFDLDTQRRRLEDYYKLARKTGEALKDTDGTKFRHTNFYPIEQYDFRILEKMAEMQAEGLGEVEIHYHHGIDAPDSAGNLKRTLAKYRDIFAGEHNLLSRFDNDLQPKYAFVHGNLALGNSSGGKYCGVDEEMQILRETGCYVDMTLPAASDESQVAMFNQIYECSLPLNEKIPHRKGRAVEVFGKQPQLPLIFTGPLMINWTRRINGIPIPRIEDGALVFNQPMDLDRFNRWVSANITVKGKTDWVFVKLYCHGFFDHDESACIGEDVRKFFGEIIENGEKTDKYKVHFASAREAVNMVWAAIDGKSGNPNEFRDYRLKTIMSETAKNIDAAAEKFAICQ